jgi:hypothetical protein
LLSPGTYGFTGDATFPDVETARKAWPDYRRETWEKACHGCLPCAAEVFDRLTVRGSALVWATWQSETFDLKAVRKALAGDRAAVRRFQRRDPKGAKTIADFLDVFLAALDRVDAEAVRIAARPADQRWQGGPPEINWGRRYGDDPNRPRRTDMGHHHARVH